MVVERLQVGFWSVEKEIQHSHMMILEFELTSSILLHSTIVPPQLCHRQQQLWTQHQPKCQQLQHKFFFGSIIRFII